MQRGLENCGPNQVQVLDAVRGGSGDICYGIGYFDLAEDECLVFESAACPMRASGRSRCSTSGWSRSTTEPPELLEPRPGARRRRRRLPRGDRPAKDPGVPNWLDTGWPPLRGRSSSAGSGRTDKPTPTVRSAPRSSRTNSRASLPDDHPRVTPDESRGRHRGAPAARRSIATGCTSHRGRMRAPWNRPPPRKIAIVTGASRGIGKATALALADAGFDLVLAARTVQSGDEHADMLRNADGSALPGSLEETRDAVVAKGRRARVQRLDLLEAGHRRGAGRRHARRRGVASTCS